MEVKFSLLKVGEEEKLISFIQQILQEGNSHNTDLYDLNYWKWQYRNLPTGISKVYIASLEDKIVGYYHVPVYFGRFNDRSIKLAAVQDVAVDSNTRGMGVFRKLSEFAAADLEGSEIDIIYTFPNEKSIHTFLKYNSYEFVKTLDTYILLLNTSNVLRKKLNIPIFTVLTGFIADLYGKVRWVKKPSNINIELLKEVTPDVEQLFLAHDLCYTTTILRNRSYLNWRYFNKPGKKHYLLTLKKEDKVSAAVILKKDGLMGTDALIIMDYAVQNHEPDHLLLLLQELKKKPFSKIEEPYDLIMVSGHDSLLKRFTKIGFIEIPKKINPRKLKLLVKSNNIKFDASDASLWRITLSDWDVL